MEPRKLQGMSGFDINEAYRLLAASVEAAPRELSPPEATALSSQVTVHCSKEQGAFSSSPSVVMATVLPRGISSVGKTPSLTSKMVMVRPSGEGGVGSGRGSVQLHTYIRMYTVCNECACVGREAVSAGQELGQGTW